MVQCGKWKLDIETHGGRSVVRLENGYALTLGATKKCLNELLEGVRDGKWDDYIEKHCKGGV